MLLVMMSAVHELETLLDGHSLGVFLIWTFQCQFNVVCMLEFVCLFHFKGPAKPTEVEENGAQHQQETIRQELQQYWARWGIFYKYQPLDHIR